MRRIGGGLTAPECTVRSTDSYCGSADRLIQDFLDLREAIHHFSSPLCRFPGGEARDPSASFPVMQCFRPVHSTTSRFGDMGSPAGAHIGAAGWAWAVGAIVADGRPQTTPFGTGDQRWSRSCRSASRPLRTWLRYRPTVRLIAIFAEPSAPSDEAARWKPPLLPTQQTRHPLIRLEQRAPRSVGV
jgi:hypothetical protein